MRGRMGDTNTIGGVWRAAVAIIAKHPLATLAPAVVLGAIGEVPSYLIDERRALDLALSLVAAYVAYYLYLAYAEGIVGLAERGEQHLSPRGMVDELIWAARYVPSVLGAALISLTISTLAMGLLVVPGLWLYTRWSLATPVIRDRGVGPIVATQVSNKLVRGHFWFVFMTASVAYYLEEAVIHAGAFAVGWATGSHTWGEWVGGSILAMLIIPLAAFATSLTHSSLAKRAEAVT
jgi:hypothetical protein